MIKIITSLFILGLSFGWGPCLTSCGPLVLPYILGTQKNILKAGLVYVVFSLARILAYVSLALGIFFLGRFFQEKLISIFKLILILGGSFIIFVGILVILKGSFEFGYFKFFYKHFLERTSPSPFLFGLIVGFLPCGPLLGILSYIGLVSRHWFQTIIYSLSFGLGSSLSGLIPLVIFLGWLPQFFIKRKELFQLINFICGLILIFLGLRLIFTFPLS